MAYSRASATHYYRLRQFIRDNPEYFSLEPSYNRRTGTMGMGYEWKPKHKRYVKKAGRYWEKVSTMARKLRRGVV